MEVSLAYSHRTSVVTSMDWTVMDYATNLRRAPVAFRGRVKQPILMRQLMGALQRVILSDNRWLSDEEWLRTLDPVITVHPDQLFFEALSNDESVYARLSAPFDAFEPEGEVQFGTTNIDFTNTLRDALQHLRSSRKTMFSVGPTGFGVETKIDSQAETHFERKVDLPDSWLMGFLQVQGALAIKPYRIDVRPVDLLNVIAFFQENKPKKPPYGLRYEMQPDQPVTIVLEPWEERFILKGTHYTGYARTIRLWGRKRLELLTSVLPYAQSVTVGLLGRGLPSYYICHCGDYQFVYVLSGWTDNDWATGSAFDALVPQRNLSQDAMLEVYNYLAANLSAPIKQIDDSIDLARADVEYALFQLSRAGRVILDPTTRQYRLRELFQDPLDPGDLFKPNPRIEQSRSLHQAGHVTILTMGPQKTRPEIRAEANVFDPESGDTYAVIASVDHDGRLRFGRCECPFFDQNIMSRGPCEHILATTIEMDNRMSADT